jgi:hypothetical protein
LAYVILQCGSKARGDTNIHSDSDYVCIHDKDFNIAKQIKKQFYNISFLSLETIKRLKRKGSLFLTHIDVDGDILMGEEELLLSLKGFRPSNSSLDKSILESQRFLSEMKWFPRNNIGQLWLMDVLFVALRNIIYCKNGMKSIYKFGFIDAMKSFGLSDDEINLMCFIRQGKYYFRQHQTETTINTSQIEAALEIASKVSTVTVQPELGGITSWSGNWRFDYWDERLLERAILNEEIPNDGFREKLQDHNYFRRTLTLLVKERISTLLK